MYEHFIERFNYKLVVLNKIIKLIHLFYEKKNKIKCWQVEETDMLKSYDRPLNLLSWSWSSKDSRHVLTVEPWGQILNFELHPWCKVEK